jgi:predicted Holliday junction resolvase-like endonuclease
MTTTEIALLSVTICSLIALYLVMQRSVPSSVVQDNVLELAKLKHELSHVHETVGAYRANMEVLRSNNEKLELNIHNLQTDLESAHANYDSLLHQKKSSEVRVGQLSEQVVSLIDGFDYDSKQMRFIGSPIDYVVFGEDMITFLEVKSGGSQLSAKQRHLRELVNSGKVEWKTVRLTEKGLKK